MKDQYSSQQPSQRLFMDIDMPPAPDVVTSTSSVKPKIPPYSLEAEQSVLGALMLDHRAWDAVVEHLNGSEFYQKKHSLIFDAFKSLIEKNQPVDVLTVSEYLKQKDLLTQVGGDAYLFELSNNHVWQTAFAFKDWTLGAIPEFMELSRDENGFTEWGWIDFGFQTYYALLNCGFRMRVSAGTASGVILRRVHRLA